MCSYSESHNKVERNPNRFVDHAMICGIEPHLDRNISHQKDTDGSNLIGIGNS